MVNKVEVKTEKKTTKAGLWYLFDAKDTVLGRLSTRIAMKLMGKELATWRPNVDPEVAVVVINANKVALTGKKETDKKYYRYSGYPGGLSETTVKRLREKKSDVIINHAVKGMLPKNHLADKMIARLFIYPTGDHPHQAQKPVEVKL